MSQRAEQKARTRQRILEEARRCFADKGIATTTTADIARAARVSHGAIFVHFKTRDELLTAVAQTFARELTDRLYSVGLAGGPLRQALEAHLEVLARHEDLYRRFATETTALPDEARVSWIGLLSAVGHYLSEAAERGMRSGELKRCEFALLYNTWLGLLHHYLLNRDVFAPGESVLKKLGPTLLDHFLNLASNPQLENKETQQ
jgi:AcrR family transcriptional regulator